MKDRATPYTGKSSSWPEASETVHALGSFQVDMNLRTVDKQLRRTMVSLSTSRFRMLNNKDICI